MYRLELVEQLKSGENPLAGPRAAAAVHPAVWRIGWTSLLTDISSEMVNSVLPAFVVLYLHAGPLAFGTIDGIYHGMALALLAIAAGVLADRRRRYKELAAAGYGASALAKLAMLAAGPSVAWLAAIVMVDRLGKGVRTAPRDALLSLHSRPDQLTMAFAIHRAMDAAGALLGPLVAFAILSRMPDAYDAVWVTSFAFAIVGLAVLWLFVDNPPAGRAPQPLRMSDLLDLAVRPGSFRTIAFAGAVLALFTISDGFLYLVMQSRNHGAAEYFPLYYAVTASSYMLLSVPAGLLANRIGRGNVFLLAHLVLLAIYGLLLSGFRSGTAIPWLPLVLFGLYYAGSEGVLRAAASAVLGEGHRTAGLAVLNTLTGAGRLVGSLAFGWMWHAHGMSSAVLVFAACLAVAAPVALRLVSRWSDARPS